MITEMLTRDNFVSGVCCESWEQLVDLAGEPLLKSRAIEQTFLQSVKDTIHKYGSYMVLVDDIALFHGRPDSGVHKTAISLALVTKPVFLGDARIKAAFVLAAVDNNSHIDLMKDLATGLADEQLLMLLRNDGSTTEVLSRLKQLEENREEP